MGSASHHGVLRQDHTLSVKGDRVSISLWARSTKITDWLRKDKGRRADVESITQCRLTQDHAQTVEGRRSIWGQHPIAGSYEIHTNYGRTKVDMRSPSHCRLIKRDHVHTVDRTQPTVGSASYCRLMQRDHAHTVEGTTPTSCQYPIPRSYNKITDWLWKHQG